MGFMKNEPSFFLVVVVVKYTVVNYVQKCFGGGNVQMYKGSVGFYIDFFSSDKVCFQAV